MKFEKISNLTCGVLTFNSCFDSGNLGRVELIKQLNDGGPPDAEDLSVNTNDSNGSSKTSGATKSSNEGQNIPTYSGGKEKRIDAEYNLWTRPDCHGTTFENSNRTWFYFSIQGGVKDQVMKFNIMNLNKQSKLYSQGMNPVVKYGLNGKWERMKEKPTFYLTDENFILSFCHRIHEGVEKNLTYYAFTFPFTYTELQELLGNYDKIHSKSEDELASLLNKTNEKVIKDSSLDDDSASVVETSVEVPKQEFVVKSQEQSIIVDENTSESMQQLSNLVKKVKIAKNVATNESANTANISQDDWNDDIYYYRELLINSIEQRRVDILTITSFHGIENKREDRLKNIFPDFSKPRCHSFRNKKIIFISSRVHPGETPASFVLNGFVNLLLERKNVVALTLRKMYVFKIVPFLNPDGVYNGLYRSDTLGHNLNRVYINPHLDTQPSIYAVRKLIRFYHFGCDKPDTVDEISQMILDDPTLPVKEEEASCDIIKIINEESVNRDDKKIVTNAAEHDEKQRNQVKEDVDIGNPKDANQDTLECNEKTRKSQPENKLKSESSTSLNNFKETASKFARDKKLSLRCASKNKSSQSWNPLEHSTYKHYIPHDNSDKQQKQGLNQKSNRGINFSIDFRAHPDENNEKSINETSNLYLYLDLHGHASKKGVFMYGNHMPSTQETVEVMLLPRLMSINCRHFAFDACNFSERNMYLKGKRDGLSKEGSGRVAVYKSTGLIKSYTLESNYNMAKCVNILPPKGKEVACKAHNINPPKFTPVIFEEVGRALGPSLLDLTNSNPDSRVINSEFRSLQGLRNSLKNEISRGLSRTRVSKFAKINKKRPATTALPTTSAQDIFKENNISSPSIKLISHVKSKQHHEQTSKAINLSQGTKVLGSKIKGSGKVQAFTKKDVNVFSASKKKKVLCETLLGSASAPAVNTVLVNQIPRKKIKVSSVGINNAYVKDLVKGETSTKNILKTQPEIDLTNIFLSASNTIEDDVPCCSKTITSLMKAPLSPSSSSTSSGSQVKITNFLPIKKLIKARKPNFDKTNAKFRGKTFISQSVIESVDDTHSNSPLTHDTPSTSQIILQSSKLLKKKKRSLKTERKKSRCQKPLLH